MTLHVPRPNYLLNKLLLANLFSPDLMSLRAWIWLLFGKFDNTAFTF